MTKNAGVPGSSHSRLLARKVQVMAAEALTDTRVVTLNGARQSGKSTLAALWRATP
ncbi:hypothetical protein [Nocardia panacis]|uniref:hypothetical protein n=1 Tax=Nocardia panacis TaxID=2340916 RepID=UPI00131522C3|nr:hypothetical protein [Nocardia panacis]